MMMADPYNISGQRDFIQRPGQAPLGFDKNDIIVGGTSLLSSGGGTNSGGVSGGSEEDMHLTMLLERLINIVERGTTINLDGNKLGQGLVLGSSRIGTTVR